MFSKRLVLQTHKNQGLFGKVAWDRELIHQRQITIKLLLTHLCPFSNFEPLKSIGNVLLFQLLGLTPYVGDDSASNISTWNSRCRHEITSATGIVRKEITHFYRYVVVILTSCTILWRECDFCWIFCHNVNLSFFELPLRVNELTFYHTISSLNDYEWYGFWSSGKRRKSW